MPIELYKLAQKELGHGHMIIGGTLIHNRSSRNAFFWYSVEIGDWLNIMRDIHRNLSLILKPFALQGRAKERELSCEKVSARLQPATAGHARLVLSKQLEQIYTFL